ncbi:uridine kinase [Strigomonas culicis]|uniref:Uridine kinase n=1 Tax=Strigomonas culicis TaxID=28005 RepID=S9UR15_9TRYP|nr:uridine kinase [Strigomonas culicis]EPY35592.1 uridine kinase [Strigomonas culicis]|eukprot:EPY31333.1 uridine kinase [Strigomonas culicis]
MQGTIVIGVAGPSGSGKTRLATLLAEAIRADLGEDSVGILSEDFYYRDQSHVALAARAHVNYDHPSALDHALLAAQLAQLVRGEAVALPQYDYTQHTRAAHTVPMAPRRVLLVEGILLFTNDALREAMDYRVFVDTPLDICFIRRAQRDMRERGRTFESVVAQYEATVRPMYTAFIAPSRAWADLLVPSWRDNRVAIDVLKARICEHAGVDSKRN